MSKNNFPPVILSDAQLDDCREYGLLNNLAKYDVFCDLESDSELRRQIGRTAATWCVSVNVAREFGDSPTLDLRDLQASMGQLTLFNDPVELEFIQEPLPEFVA